MCPSPDAQQSQMSQEKGVRSDETRARQFDSSEGLDEHFGMAQLMTVVPARTKPIDDADEGDDRSSANASAKARLNALTRRQREVMIGVCEGLSNKVIAERLDISQRTVEYHRAQVMKRTACASLRDLIRLVMRAS